MEKTRKILTCGILGILILVLPVVTVAGELSIASSFVIRHEDMEPYLKPNDTVMYSNSTSFDDLKIGDVIVFRAPEAKTEDGKPKVIVHRVAEIGNFFQKEVIRTRGDANPYSIPGTDYPLFKENYIGEVVSVTNNTNTTITTNAETETETRTLKIAFLKAWER